MSYNGKKPITFWIDEDIHEIFVKKCNMENSSRSGVLRRLVTEYIANYQKPDLSEKDTICSHMAVDLGENEEKSWIKKILKR